jgi:hypothetical protein
MATNFKEDIVNKVIDNSNEFGEEIEQLRDLFKVDIKNTKDAFKLMHAALMYVSENYNIYDDDIPYMVIFRQGGVIRCLCNQYCKKWLGVKEFNDLKEKGLIGRCEKCLVFYFKDHYNFDRCTYCKDCKCSDHDDHDEFSAN